jgi:hypothetical protein
VIDMAGIRTLLRHHELVAQEPGAWMPWNYAAALARLAPGETSPR